MSLRLQVWLAALAALLSAMALVWASYSHRARFGELQMLQNRHHQLQVERGQILLEHGNVGSLARIEQIAGQRLMLRPPKPDEVVWLPPR